MLLILLTLISTVLAVRMILFLEFLSAPPETWTSLQLVAISIGLASLLSFVSALVAKTRRPQRIVAAPQQEKSGEEAVQVLALLQERGRLLDFLMDDVTPYTDEQIGRAARVVHQGCKSVLAEHFDIIPVHAGHEGEELTVNSDLVPPKYRLIGAVGRGQRAKVLHRGWRANKTQLPRQVGVQIEPGIVAPAELEVK